MTHLLVWLTFVVFLKVCYPITAQVPEVTRLEKFYYDKCLKTTGKAETFDRLRTDVYEMYKYFQYAFQFLPENKNVFCNSERSNLAYRAKDVEKDLKACLAPDEQFLPVFLRTSFEELLHFFCHNDGEYTTRFFSTETSQCRNSIESSKSNDLDNCLNRIFAPVRNHITKAELCDDVTVARKCYTQLVELHCPRSYDVKRLNTIFFDYVRKPCSSCVFGLNSLLVVGLVLFNLLVNY